MKKCKTCAKCKQLYRRPEYRYYKDDKLYCSERECVIDGEDYCKQWKKNQCAEGGLSERLDEAIEDIKYLIGYFAKR